MSGTRSRTRTWMRRLYVPLMTVVLLGSVGTYWAQGGSFDPNTAAQNPRIRFQTAADAATAPGLTTREAIAASAVVDPNRSVEPDRLQLLYLGTRRRSPSWIGSQANSRHLKSYSSSPCSEMRCQWTSAWARSPT